MDLQRRAPGRRPGRAPARRPGPAALAGCRARSRFPLPGAARVVRRRADPRGPARRCRQRGRSGAVRALRRRRRAAHAGAQDRRQPHRRRRLSEARRHGQRAPRWTGRSRASGQRRPSDSVRRRGRRPAHPGPGTCIGRTAEPRVVYVPAVPGERSSTATAPPAGADDGATVLAEDGILSPAAGSVTAPTRARADPRGDPARDRHRHAPATASSWSTPPASGVGGPVPRRRPTAPGRPTPRCRATP